MSFTLLLFYLAAFVLILGVLIVVHEWGHYLAARACGVKVLRFSIGFGKVVWQKKCGVDQTEWAVSLLPLGGYVKMLDEREGEVDKTEVHRAFNRQSVGKRSLIVVAGPVGNFLLAILIYWFLFIQGVEEVLPVVGSPPPATAAAGIGLQNGDQIRAIDGEPIKNWSELRWVLLKKAAEKNEVRLEILTEAHNIIEKNLSLAVVSENRFDGDAIRQIGIVFYRPKVPAVIGQVLPDKPAAKAGLREGDKVLAVNGKAIADWLDLVDIIQKSPGQRLDIDIDRAGQTMRLSAVVDSIQRGSETIGQMGIALSESLKGLRDLRTITVYGPLDAFGKALQETWDKSIFSLKMLGKMLTGDVSVKNLSGPVTIADYAGKSASHGLSAYLQFMALISLSLGLLNLLPIPVLDGGHLLYHLVEVVRRKPLSERAMEIAQRFGMSLLFVLMAFAFFNDINRLFSS